MRKQLFHVFRNTPLGREALLHSRHFCESYGVEQMEVYIPPYSSFNLSFGLKEVIVFLDRSYLRNPDTAKTHADEILSGANITTHYFTCHKFKDRNLPQIPSDFMYMTCPRVVSEAGGRLGLGHVGAGHIGPAVYSIVKHAPFPVLVPSTTFVPWTSLSVLYGGSPLGQKALKLALELGRRCDMPVKTFTYVNGHNSVESCEATLEQARLLDAVRGSGWTIWRGGSLQDRLYDIPRDSLVVLGAAGQGAVKELAVGSMFQRIHPELPHPILIVGPGHVA